MLLKEHSLDIPTHCHRARTLLGLKSFVWFSWKSYQSEGEVNTLLRKKQLIKCSIKWCIGGQYNCQEGECLQQLLETDR